MPFLTVVLYRQTEKAANSFNLEFHEKSRSILIRFFNWLFNEALEVRASRARQWSFEEACPERSRMGSLTEKDLAAEHKPIKNSVNQCLIPARRDFVFLRVSRKGRPGHWRLRGE